MTYVLYAYSISNRTHTYTLHTTMCNNSLQFAFALQVRTFLYPRLKLPHRLQGMNVLDNHCLDVPVLKRPDQSNGHNEYVMLLCLHSIIYDTIEPQRPFSYIKSSLASGDFIPSLNFCHGSVTWTMEELIAPASKLISYRVLDTKDELIVVGYSPTK